MTIGASTRNGLRATAIMAGLAVSFSAGALANGKHGGHDHSDGGHGHGHGHAANIGEPGKPGAVSRTIEISMTENAFSPNRITVKKDETIRFVLKNNGEAVHEFNIGTAAMHVAHREEMMMMVKRGILEVDRINHERMAAGMGGRQAMMHDDPNSKLVEPGKTGEIIWKFSADAELEFACNVPGHYESGMKGHIRFR